MSDSILDKYTRPRPDDVASANDNEGADDFGAFGWLRGVRDRAIMLELRHRDGKISSFGYAWLERAEFDPSEGITLHFAGRSVKIAGRNLNAELRPNLRLFAGILRHRVPWVQEADRAMALEAPGGAVVIEELHMKD
jgi:hypothetical protein